MIDNILEMEQYLGLLPKLTDTPLEDRRKELIQQYQDDFMSIIDIHQELQPSYLSKMFES